MLHGILIPTNAGSRLLRGGHNTLVDAERLAQNRICPVDNFESISGRRHGQEMRAHFRKKMRR